MSNDTDTRLDSVQQDAPPYYAKDGRVWKRPIRTERPEGGWSVTLGFPVCTPSEAVGDEGAETIAEMLDQAECAGPLTAAAPDLLAAAKSALGCLTGNMDGDMDLGDPVEMLRNAISLATKGEENV